MTRYALGRLLLAIPTLIGITLAVFLLIHLTPGDPVEMAQASGRPPRVAREAVEQMRRTFWLDRPLPIQYLHWLDLIAHGTLGVSIQDRRPVTARILERLPNTLALQGAALAVVLALAVPLGVVSAIRRGTRFDRAAATTLFLLYSIPSFWAALLLILIFNTKLGWLPLFGMASEDALAAGGWTLFTDRLAHLVLPVVCSSYAALAFFSRFTRSGLLEVVRQDYIRTARAKGLGESRVVARHALRNTMIPLITLLGLVLPALVSGSVIVEKIFAWPGIGKLFFEAALARDYPVIMGLTLCTALVTLAATLAADLAYAWADPRIRYD